MKHPSLADVVLGVFVVGSVVSPTAAQELELRPRGDSGGLVAVLPFANITGSADDAWIGDGIAETVMTDLQERNGFEVIGRERVEQELAGMGVDGRGALSAGAMFDFGRRVGARWVVVGGYQRVGGQIRITGQLVTVADATVVRSAKIDGAIDDLFDLQDRVSAQLVDGAPPGGMRAAAPRARPPASAPAVPGSDTPAPAAAPATSGASGRFGAFPAAGGTAAAAAVAAASAPRPGVIDGPAPPIPPAVINRDAEGRVTVRAIRLDQGIALDGQLDEAVYRTVEPITGFVQLEPDAGAPATEETEVWIMFDDTNMYVGGRLHDSAPPSEWVANEMRRDTNQLRQNETLSVFFDTFYDRRNGFHFYTNPLGARADQQFTNEGNPNSDWNPVWDVRTGRFDGGWTVEMEIPFKSLRYRPGAPQVWGVQLRRAIRHKNEWVFLTRLPVSAGGGQGARGIFRVSSAATLVGVEPPGGSRNLEIKPYAIGGLTTDVNAGTANARDGDFGLDVKYGLTANLTADLTYNTDFAQVEVDEQQVNLTRFSLFFPEKREFFLEGRGIFDFGGGGGRGGGGGGGAPTLFYSRRIGLERGTVVPILGGGRITGKIGPFDVGVLNIQTDDSLDAGVDSTNFTALRIKRDILRRSNIGGIFTNRSLSRVGDGVSQSYGLDSTLAFGDSLSLTSYFARTRTPGITTGDSSYQAQVSYEPDLYGFSARHLVVEDNFIPEVGFARRDNFRHNSAAVRFSPRPALDLVRRFSFTGGFDYYETADLGLVETREATVGFEIQLENSDAFSVALADTYEFLEDPFQISDGVPLPIGGYGFRSTQLSYGFGAQRRVSGNFAYRTGSFWTGDIRTIAYNRGRINVLDQFSIEPSISFNWVDLPEGAFSAKVVSSRFNYAFTPRMFFGGLVQYNSSREVLSTNMRLRWEYSPGSELFVVYTEEQTTDPLRPNRFSELRNRGFVVKLNRLFRY